MTTPADVEFIGLLIWLGGWSVGLIAAGVLLWLRRR